MSYVPQVFWITAIVTVFYQLLYFFIAFGCQFDKVTDFAGGTNFAINAVIALVVAANYTSKTVVAVVLVLIWALRLAVFLLLRVLKAGEDNRFDEMRKHFFPFLGFWISQMMWVFTCGIPVSMLCASGDTSAFGSPTDIAGLILWIVGFLIEAISDQHKFYYRFNTLKKFKSENPGKTPPVFRRGLWNFSRQPNYFGEILLWWGMFVLCLHQNPNNSSLPYASIVSPIFITLLLLFLSGIPLSEKGSQKKYLVDNKEDERKLEYLEYRKSTSVLIPLPKSVYRNLPIWFKRVFLFEFRIYESEELKKCVE